ncbi:hypothetical protein CYLTODRAFT_319182, partial [Cylindrobasidium torrendii FP15055 ss-10]
GVRQYARQALRFLAEAHDGIIASRVFQSHYANRRRKEDDPGLAVGAKVYLSTKNLNLPKDRARKLAPKFIGPFEIVQ